LIINSTSFPEAPDYTSIRINYYAKYVPVAVHSKGGYNSLWKTDVYLFPGGSIFFKNQEKSFCLSFNSENRLWHLEDLLNIIYPNENIFGLLSYGSSFFPFITNTRIYNEIENLRFWQSFLKIKFSPPLNVCKAKRGLGLLNLQERQQGQHPKNFSQKSLNQKIYWQCMK